MGRLERRQKQKLTWKKLWQKFKSRSFIFKLSAGFGALFLIALLILNILIWQSDVSGLEKAAPQPTIIYDRHGGIASKISNSKIEGVPFEEIPEHMIHAVIAVEDQHFYNHHGLNYFGILRAFWQNMTTGEIVAGGSTITQQLTKNVFLTHERTYERKIQELILTKKVERTYTKDEIMERYLNQIYFGEGAWGIQRAAKTYFGKEASELTLGESALLAGLIKAPNALSPFKNMDKALKRRQLVLSLMEQEGYITTKEKEAAEAQPLVLEGRKQLDEYKGQYPYYVDHIIAEAIEKYDLTENEVLSGGLKIYTELNPVLQKAAEDVLADEELFPSGESQLMQAGAIFISPDNGGIQALVGGRGEHTFRGFNRATQLKRQPGSVMKPIAVFTPALEEGYEVFGRLQDTPLNINGYQPMNFDRKFRGEVSMYEALIRSYNVPTVWLLEQIGLEKGIEAVKRFGIPLTENDQHYALALGGMSEGVSPLEMAEAYSVYPNEGVRPEAHAITKIENADGELLGKWQHNAVKVTDAEIAQTMTFMLKGVVEEGTGKKAKVKGWEIAGKTGTTQLPFKKQNGAKDHWFVGYTPEIVAAIWMGYDQTDEKHYMTSTSGATVAKAFQLIFTKAEKEFSEKKFDLSLVEEDLNKQLAAEKKRQEEERRKAEEEKRKQEKAKEKEEREEEKKERKDLRERWKELIDKWKENE